MSLCKKLIPILFFICLFPGTLFAQEVHDDFQGTWKGRVTEVLSNENRVIPGTDTEYLFQAIKAEVLDGPLEGKTIQIENDYLELKKGNTFYFNYFVDINGVERYGLLNIDRRNSLFLLLIIFVGVVVVFGRMQGVRSLIALAGSFVAIFYILIPGLLHGWNPLVASFLVSSGILFGAIFFTHGFNRESLVAYSGTMIAVLITGLFAMFAV